MALLLPNCFEFVAIWFAVAKLGAIEAPNNPDLKGELLSHNLNNCGAKVLVADARRLSDLANIQDQLPLIETLILIDTTATAARAAGVTIKQIVTFDECMTQPDEFEPVDVHYSDPMAILYTSGTTGPAKGVLMSHHHCYCWTMAMALNLGYTAADSYFCTLPLFHTDAQMFASICRSSLERKPLWSKVSAHRASGNRYEPAERQPRTCSVPWASSWPGQNQKRTIATILFGSVSAFRWFLIKPRLNTALP